MSRLNIIFIISTEIVNSKNTLSISLLKQKQIEYTVVPCNETYSGISIEAPFHTILECFYVLKDDLIQRSENAVVRKGETFQIHSMQVYIPNLTARSLIGKGGIGITNIRSIAYTNIVISTKDSCFEDMSLLLFEGDYLGIPQAFNLVLERILMLNPRLSWISSNMRRMSALTDVIMNSSRLSSSNDYTLAFMRALNPNLLFVDTTVDSEDDHDLDAFLTFRLDAKKVGSVIGDKGSVISEIRKSTSAQIILQSDHDAYSCRRVDIGGKLPNVIQAAQLVHEKSQSSASNES